MDVFEEKYRGPFLKASSYAIFILYVKKNNEVFINQGSSQDILAESGNLENPIFQRSFLSFFEK